MVATDGHRLSMKKHRRSSGHHRGLSRSVAEKAMLELQKLAADADPAAIVYFSGDENHLFFKL